MRCRGYAEMELYLGDADPGTSGIPLLSLLP